MPDGFVYLRTDPATCLKRLQKRQRSEEGGVSLDYLQNLHEKHEAWLGNALKYKARPPFGVRVLLGKFTERKACTRVAKAASEA